MKIDLMARPMTWDGTATAAQELEALGISGMLFTEAVQVQWMSIAAAARATTMLELSTGIAVAFPRSPMISRRSPGSWPAPSVKRRRSDPARSTARP